MSSLNEWQRYEEDVARVAGDLTVALTGTGKRVRVEKDVPLEGGNGRLQRADVLATAGLDALFIECKDFVRKVVGPSEVAATIYKFLNVCRGNPSRRWRLAIVAPRDIRAAAMAPAIDYPAVPTAANLAGGTLRGSSHFVYFAPPDNPRLSASLFVIDEGRPRLHRGDAVRDRGLADAWTRLHDPQISLAFRVASGLSLLAGGGETLAGSPDASRTLVHGLLHLGRVQEAMYVRRLIIPDRGGDTSLEIEHRMMRFNLADRTNPRTKRPGWRQIQALTKMIGSGSVRDDVSIGSFVGPVVIRWGEEEVGRRLLGGIGPLVEALDTEDAPYYELLRLVRLAQLAEAPTERAELMEAARLTLGVLPVWNRRMGEGLLKATEARPHALHGLDVPLNVEAWSAAEAS